MPDLGIFADIPLWIILPGAYVIALAAWDVSFRFGRGHRVPGKPESEQSVATMVSTIVGLVAFLLAFTFSMAGYRFQERRAVLIEDVNAIGTTYLRTSLIAEPERSSVRSLLRDYADERLSSAPRSMAERIAATDEIRQQIWQQATAVAAKDRSIFASLFVTSVNQMIDTHGKRMNILFAQAIPDAIWFALVGLTALGFCAMGYQHGLFYDRRHPEVLVTALMFAVVIYIIADLDRPGRGMIQIDQQAMSDLRRSMN